VNPTDPADPWDTSGIRDRVLTAWASAPVRFREDANAEEDLVLGGYRDRLVVELAQNAADAATRAGVPGRLLLRLDRDPAGDVLTVANTGAGLDADGVQALCTLRASAKRDPDGTDPVGRFGVGFAAVLAVTDEPEVYSGTGGIRFGADRTRELLRERADGAPDLVTELDRRDGHVPVLRLPFPAVGSPPQGYSTAVRLPLRDQAAAALVHRLLTDLDDTLLLALPGLDEVTVRTPDAPDRVISDVTERWMMVHRTGRWDPAVLADRPTEERRRTGWSLTWALPRRQETERPRSLYAPTPSDEPMDWPALLIASFPMDHTRRHVADGPATDVLVVEAAAAYVDLVARIAADREPVWPLVPVGLPAGALDGRLRREVLRILPDRPLLVSAAGDDRLIPPRDAVVLEPPLGQDPEAISLLAAGCADLVVLPGAASAAAATLGLNRPPPAEIVDMLPPVPDPAWWRQLYGVLAPGAVDSTVREALAGLGVPLADGRVVRGIRGTVIWRGARSVAEALAPLGVRVVHPDAVHPLLERLGATPVGPRDVLDLPEIRDIAVDGQDDGLLWEDPGADPTESPGLLPGPVEAVLTLVSAALGEGRWGTRDLDWVGRLPLLDDRGDQRPADTLAIPGSRALDLFDIEEVAAVHPDLVARWGVDVLRAVGVLEGLAVVRADDVVPDQRPPRELDVVVDAEDWSVWTAQLVETVAGAVDSSPVPGDLVVTGLTVIGDLDLVVEEAWPRALTEIATDPDLRTAVIRPLRVLLHGTGSVEAVEVPSWSAWWLRRRFAGGRAWADPLAEDPVAAVLPEAPEMLAGVDPPLRTALGSVTGIGTLGPESVRTVMDRLARPEVTVDAATLLRVWTRLARLVREHPDLLRIGPGERVRVIDGDGTRVVPAEDAVVVDGPQWLQRTDLGPAVIGSGTVAARALADLFRLPLAGDLAPGTVAAGAGHDAAIPVPEPVFSLLPDAPRYWREHDRLLVDGVEVDWWLGSENGEVIVHAATTCGLADGLAWARGAWSLRSAVAEVLEEPQRLGELLVRESFSDVGGDGDGSPVAGFPPG
jgi:hypothetical protein